ncbi:MAG TPA: divergent polysaccharide deacetylase family protein [Spirochaetia bacterium]|nr:divergent polysaccharide deacetylase family protein [Spirochaetia bacterium]
METIRVTAALSAIAVLLLALLAFLPSTGGRPVDKTITSPVAAQSDGPEYGGTIQSVPTSGAGGGSPDRLTPQSRYGSSEMTGTLRPAPVVAPPQRLTVPATYKSTAIPHKAKWKLYLDIDDVGNNVFQLKPFLSFPGPLTVAVLPLREYSAEAARLAHAAGKEVILHLPMEADDPNINPGAGAIMTSMSDQAIAQTVERDIESVPYIIGVNNHEGSRATADPRVMEVVLKVVKSHGLFFLDSRTTAKSVVKGIAEQLGVPFAEREVFLDNQQTKSAIESSLKDAEQIAEKHGYAVMIGHVWTDTLAQTLTDLYPELIDRGFEFGKLSDLIHESDHYARTGN